MVALTEQNRVFCRDPRTRELAYRFGSIRFAISLRLPVMESQFLADSDSGSGGVTG